MTESKGSMFPTFYANSGMVEDFDSAKAVVLPVPYEGTVCFGHGTSDGPAALLAASKYMEDYDEVLELCPCSVGIHTMQPPALPEAPEDVAKVVESEVGKILDAGKFPLVIGGEHSISGGVFRALNKKYPGIGVVQFDAHTDLRPSYQGYAWSHACVMSHIREDARDVVQLGMRSISSEEIDIIKESGIGDSIGPIHKIRNGSFDWRGKIDALPSDIFVTFDLDAFDLSVIRATGTPEPGGMTWTEADMILEYIFKNKNVVGCDIMELCGGSTPCAYSAARLAYRMIGRALC
ncbi:MAG: agmatinase [Planctomycetes bacterium]|nr:agmatinase [Planctomycetota bacterium]